MNFVHTVLFVFAVSFGASANMNDAGMKHNDGMDHAKMDHSMMKMDSMSAVGMSAKGAKPDKVVHVVLTDDMKINFKKDVDIKSNDVVQFVVINKGKLLHEFAIGSKQEQETHRKQMKHMHEDHNHDNELGNVVTVPPGKAKQLLWHFHGDKEVQFACNIPNHAEQGMVKTIHLE